MDTPTPQKKGLGPLAWIGIGCGGIIVLAIIAFVVFGVLFGGKLKKFAEDAQKNPTRTTATTMVTVSGGQFEMIAEDDANKRYTVREKKSGNLTTIYWNEKKKAPEVISGDFSAIPADAGSAPTTTEPGSASEKAARAVRDAGPAPDRR
ncbi:MAG: hypothetical protein QOE70_1778 [Chthoniobacter sp.]|jgi:hypothetical protein|nr:hypothetical protein [Chthoniobacter sp.]